MSDPDPLEQARSEAIEAIRHEGARVAVDTRLEIQEKTRQWVTVSAGFLVLAFSLLAFFGYKETTDFRRKLAELEEQAQSQTERQVQALETRTQEMRGRLDAEYQAATEQIATARRKLAQAEASFESRVQQLEAASQRLAESRALLEQARGLEAAYSEAQADVQRQLQQIAKLQNSFFNIFVMYQAPASQAETLVDPLLARIREAGFVVEPENVMALRVDRTEILYYDPSRPPQVEKLLGLLRDSPAGQAMTARGEPPQAVFEGRRNPRDLLIKIRGR